MKKKTNLTGDMHPPRRVSRKRLADLLSVRACPGVTVEIVRALDPEAYQWWIDRLGAVPAPRDGGPPTKSSEVGDVSKSQ